MLARTHRVDVLKVVPLTRGDAPHGAVGEHRVGHVARAPLGLVLAAHEARSLEGSHLRSRVRVSVQARGEPAECQRLVGVSRLAAGW